MQSLPVVIIRCEENEINQLDFRIQTNNIRCFILLSGLRKFLGGLLLSILLTRRTQNWNGNTQAAQPAKTKTLKAFFLFVRSLVGSRMQISHHKQIIEPLTLSSFIEHSLLIVSLVVDKIETKCLCSSC